MSTKMQSMSLIPKQNMGGGFCIHSKRLPKASLVLKFMSLNSEFAAQQLLLSADSSSSCSLSLFSILILYCVYKCTYIPVNKHYNFFSHQVKYECMHKWKQKNVII